MMKFWGILGPPSYGIGATIRIGREMLCLPYAGFFVVVLNPSLSQVIDTAAPLLLLFPHLTLPSLMYKGESVLVG